MEESYKPEVTDYQKQLDKLNQDNAN